MSDRRQLPPWLLGLIIAAILFIIGVLVLQALGFGDDPSLAPGALAGWEPSQWSL